MRTLLLPLLIITLFLNSLSLASPRPFLEIAAGYPEAVDLRFGVERGPYGIALGTGLPVLAWSKTLRNDSELPTAWNPSVTLYAHYGSGRLRYGPEAQALYFYGVTDEYAAVSAVSPDGGDFPWARWRVDAFFFKQSLALRAVFGSWYAQAAPGLIEMRMLDFKTEGTGKVSKPDREWDFRPGLSFGLGRRF